MLNNAVYSGQCSQTVLRTAITFAQLWREELGDVRTVEVVVACMGTVTLICELCERSKLSGKGCQIVATEVSNRRARMGSVQSSTVNVSVLLVQ